MQTNHHFLLLIVSILFLSTSSFAQTGNFDQTWQEFLENDKISNMSELIRPNPTYEQPKYARYLLMNTNSSFCQSDLQDAENLMAQIDEIDSRVYTSIPGFVGKMEELQAKIKAYYTMDGIWLRFLETKEVSIDELDAVTEAKRLCEKRTLAKYSYMMAYHHFCEGDIEESKNIFQNRTLRLTEQTTLRVRDVEGLEDEVDRMKALYEDMATLDNAWNTYVRTGTSPGFDMELPLFPCNPVPKMKELMLKGVLDVCSTGPGTLEQIRKLQADSGVRLDRDLQAKIRELEAAVAANDANVATLNTAWEAFIPDNKVRHMGQYGYEYCEKEPLIRAYIMDGFAFPCEMARDMLDRINELQSAELTPLEQITMIKINELADLSESYQADGAQIERLWNQFVAQGDRLTNNYQSAEFYCDNIHQVKDWTMKGLSASCEGALPYLEQIEDFQNTFEFNFTEDLECRVQKLRIKVWDCRHEALVKLARIEAPDAYEQRLQELMVEYRMEERPEVCPYE